MSFRLQEPGRYALWCDKYLLATIQSSVAAVVIQTGCQVLFACEDGSSDFSGEPGVQNLLYRIVLLNRSE